VQFVSLNVTAPVVDVYVVPFNVTDQFVPAGSPVWTKVIAYVADEYAQEKGALVWNPKSDPEEKAPEILTE
jgi:hypothetical protein